MCRTWCYNVPRLHGVDEEVDRAVEDEEELGAAQDPVWDGHRVVVLAVGGLVNVLVYASEIKYHCSKLIDISMLPFVTFSERRR